MRSGRKDLLQGDKDKRREERRDSENGGEAPLRFCLKSLIRQPGCTKGRGGSCSGKGGGGKKKLRRDLNAVVTWGRAA